MVLDCSLLMLIFAIYIENVLLVAEKKLYGLVFVNKIFNVGVKPGILSLVPFRLKALALRMLLQPSVFSENINLSFIACC